MAISFSVPFLTKVIVTALVVAGVAELSRRYNVLAALLASLPLTSLLAFIWMHAEGQPALAVADLARSILWLVLPSLLFFISLPLLLEKGVGFWPAMGFACLITVIAYGVTLTLLGMLAQGRAVQ